VHICSCGHDLTSSKPQKASAGALALTAAIENAAGGQNATGTVEMRQLGFPSELGKLKLSALLRLVRFLGSIQQEGNLLARCGRSQGADLDTATQMVSGASRLLANWPESFIKFLRRNASKSDQGFTFVGRTFGTFYRRLFADFSGDEFGFLHRAFERFVIQYWEGPISGQESWVTPWSLQESKWYSAEEASRVEHLLRPERLVQSGQVEGFCLKGKTRRNMNRWFISKESLKDWVARRDEKLRNYITRPEVRRILGLSQSATVNIAKGGVIRYIVGIRHTGYLFSQEDVLKLKHAFERHRVPIGSGKKAGDRITLQDATKNFLGNGSGLVSALRAVIQGTLVPVARTNRYGGVNGYIFRAPELRKFSPRVQPNSECVEYLNHNEAAMVLETSIEKVKALVRARILPSKDVHETLKLIPTAKVRAFAKRYVSTESVAARLGISSQAMVWRLQEWQIPTLAVPIAAKKKALFVRREIASSLQTPLQEAA
jgi:hypothetical protein